jgi:hypothetical protein
MPWILAAGAVLVVVVLGRLFVMNARAIKRDVNKRFREFRKGLETEATSVLGDFIDADHTHDVPTNDPARRGGASGHPE